MSFGSNLMLLKLPSREIFYMISLFIIWEMLTGAPGTLVKDAKKGNYRIIIALRTV